MIKFVFFFLAIFQRKEVEDMAVIYATLIVKGKKKIEDVPAKIRDQVKELLVDLEVPELAEQKDRNGLFILQ